MSAKFHLGWFVNARPHGWMEYGRAPWAGNDVNFEEWSSGKFLIDMARSMDRACFDYIMLEDRVAVPFDKGVDPRIDPFVILPLLAQATTGLGMIATMSTTFNLPFQLARQTASMDHITGGRFGWNIVTTAEDYAAQVFDMGDKLPPHDERYDRADEFVDLVKAIWGAWEPDALILDDASGNYVDASKIHPVDFEGKYYRTRGAALNVPPTPQGRPATAQAGSSARGRDFGARNADTIIAATNGANTPAAMKEVVDDTRARMVAFGRDPKECKILFMITPVLGETDEMARLAFDERYKVSDEKLQAALVDLAGNIGVDPAALDLDSPMPEVDAAAVVDGHRGAFENFLRLGEGGTKTLRQMFSAKKISSLDLYGTPASVARQMADAIDESGADGYLIQTRPLTRRYITEITEGLVPELQKLGVVRDHYEHFHLRENLLEF